MECIFTDYIKFTTNFLTSYFRILLENKYERKFVKPFIDRYIDVRYYNKYAIKNKDFIAKLNKELLNLAKEMIRENEDKQDKIKNIVALFSYILFIDECTAYTDLNSLLKSLFSDKNISLTYSSKVKADISDLTREFIAKKKEFFKIFENEEFTLSEKEYNNAIKLDLVQKCNLSKLYSDYAIDRAYNSEVVTENKVFLMILLASAKVLKETIELNFNTNYIIDFPSSLFDKSKKILRYLKALDDDMLKSRISLCIKYKDYRRNKNDINELINQGYGLSLELDEEYDMNFDNLFMFNNILLNKEYGYYKIIMKSKEDVKTNIITL